jgi:hypothetical protein
MYGKPTPPGNGLQMRIWKAVMFPARRCREKRLGGRDDRRRLGEALDVAGWFIRPPPASGRNGGDP